MKMNVISSTKEGQNVSSKKQFTLGGKIAGVCYMQGEYSDESVSSEEHGKRRAEMTAKNGHHSVFDHCYKTVEIQGVSKLMAMILNSLGWYTTSEKSGRYTSMCPESGLGKQMYEKWFKIFKERVTECIEYEATEKEIDKLANENARYVLSVMTPTTLVYTTSLRQWSYLYSWLEKLEKKVSYFMFYTKEHGSKEWRRVVNEFETLRKECLELRELMKKADVVCEDIEDNRDREIEFMNIREEFNGSHYFGDVYITSYPASFVHLAQTQRHRPIKHNMIFEVSTMEFYVPVMIAGTKYAGEWMKDLRDIALHGILPNATKVSVIERGCAEDFLFKCSERLCSRAMLEISVQTADTLRNMIKNSDMSESIYRKLECFLDENKSVVPKCRAFGYKCNEGCKLSKDKVLCRKV